MDIDRSLLEAYKEKGAPLISEYLHTRTTPLVIEICEGSVTHNDKKLENTDAVICIELIEHLYPDTLDDLPYNIFGFIKPKLVVITTPNADFNVLFPNFSGFRHHDHKFEWTRQQFQDWGENIVLRYPDYVVTFDGICKGPEGTEHLGSCSQMAVFHRLSEKDSCNIGVEGLFKTVAMHEYPYRVDNRSDEEKILDEAAYYIRYLSVQDCDMEEEVPLKKVLDMLRSFNISLDVLKTILEEGGWRILNRETGPVVLVPPRSTYSDYSAEEQYWSNDYSESNGDDWNRDPGPPTGLNRYLEESYLNHWDNENWDEEPSIIIPQNNSVAEENTYLFDGENGLLDSSSEATKDTEISERCADESSSKENLEAKPSLFSNLDRMSIDEFNDSFEDNIPFDLNESAISFDSFYNMKLGEAKEDSSLDLTHPSNSQEDALSSVDNPALNFQGYMSTSRASTSPEPYLLRGIQMDQRLNDSMCNESMSACWTLNGTFRQANTSKDSKCEELSRSEIGDYDSLHSIYLNTSYKESEDSDFENLNNADGNVRHEETQSVQRDNGISKEDQRSRLNSNVSLANSCMRNNQPQFTSSPKVNSKTISSAGKRKSLDRSRQKSSSSALSTIQQLRVTRLSSNNSLESSSEVSSQSNNDFDVHTVSGVTFNTAKELHNEIEDPMDEKCVETLKDTADSSSDKTLNDKQTEKESCIINSSIGRTGNCIVIDKEIQSVQSRNCDTRSRLASRRLPIEQQRVDFIDEDEGKTEINCESRKDIRESDSTKTSFNNAKDVSNLNMSLVPNSFEMQSTSLLKHERQAECEEGNRNAVQVAEAVEGKPSSPEEPVETPPNSWSPEVMDSGYPNSASAQDITPEYDLSSIAQDHISDSEPPSIAEAPRIGVLEPVEVENGDLANNNRDGEGNNMMAAEVHELEDLQPLIEVLENDLENENDIYALENDFPIWLLRILDMANPIEVEMQMRDRRELRFPDRAAGISVLRCFDIIFLSIFFSLLFLYAR